MGPELQLQPRSLLGCGDRRQEGENSGRPEQSGGRRVDRPLETALRHSWDAGAVDDRQDHLARLHSSDELGRKRARESRHARNAGGAGAMKKIAFAASAAVLGVLAWMASGTTPNITALQPPVRTSRAEALPAASAALAPSPNVPTLPGDAPRPLIMPVAGIDPSTIHDMFDEMRGGSTRRHDALDI